MPFLDTNIILTVVESVNRNDNSFNTIVRPYVTTKNFIWDRKTLFVLNPLQKIVSEALHPDKKVTISSFPQGIIARLSQRVRRFATDMTSSPQSNIRLSPSLNTIPSHLIAFLFILRRLFWTISSLHSAFLICTLIFGF